MANLTDARLKFNAGVPAGSGAAFSAAARHSRRVRLLRLAVPSIAIVGIALFVLVAWFNPFRTKEATVDVGSLNVSDGKLTMELPHLTGFNKKNESYNVTAKTASQKITSPGQIELTQLEAVISMTDKSTATLKAVAGNFDSTAEILTLRDNVDVTSTRGYSAKLSTARVDFKANTVESNDPVQVEMTTGTIDAGAMTILDGGQNISFTHGVSTQFKTKQAAGHSAVNLAPINGSSP